MNDIQREYERLEYQLGWSFLLCPQARLDDAKVAIVGLNPGGSDVGDGQWDAPEGNVFYTQHWGRSGREHSPIQQQVQAWHACLGLEPDTTLPAEFIPFRSRSEATLNRYSEAVAFGRTLWRWMLQRSVTTTFLCMGNRVCFELVQLTEAKRMASYPTAWGGQVIERWQDNAGRRIIRMPHPSRYHLFGRANAMRSEIACVSLRAAVSG
jgi:hypothetical protein